MPKEKLIEEIEHDLYTWGAWVERNRVNQGIGSSPWPTKDVTQKHRRRSRRLEGFSIERQFIDGRAAAAQYRTTVISVPHQEQKAKSTRNQRGQPHPENHDDLALEIDGYMAALKQHDPLARSAANHIYRWGSPREIILKEFKITKEKYYALKEFIPIFVMARRFERLESESKVRTA